MSKPEQINNKSEDSSTFNTSVPKLKNTNKELNDKIDKLLVEGVTKNDLATLASKDELMKLQRANLKSSNDVKATITSRMRDQTSKMIDVAKSTRDIAYNQGVQADVAGVRQQVDALQKRQDMSNVHMNEVTRQNEAMNADLKQVGPAMMKVTQAQNRNSDILTRALNDGFKIHTDLVTKSVADEFAMITGYTVDEFIHNEVVKSVNNRVAEVKQASLSTKLASEACKDALHDNYQLAHYFSDMMNVFLIELVIIVVSSLAFPGWWKLPVIILEVVVSWLINNKVNEWSEDNDD